MARYHGRKGVVYVSTTGSGNASAAIALNSWTLDQTTDKTEVTSFLDGNKVYVQGLKDVSGTIGGFWDDTEDKFFIAADSPDGNKLYLYPSADAPTRYWYGPSWLDASINVGVGDAISISANYSANGTWGRR
jgi:hypothetical protein